MRKLMAFCTVGPNSGESCNSQCPRKLSKAMPVMAFLSVGLGSPCLFLAFPPHEPSFPWVFFNQVRPRMMAFSVMSLPPPARRRHPSWTPLRRPRRRRGATSTMRSGCRPPSTSTRKMAMLSRFACTHVADRRSVTIPGSAGAACPCSACARSAKATTRRFSSRRMTSSKWTQFGAQCPCCWGESLGVRERGGVSEA